VIYFTHFAESFASTSRVNREGRFESLILIFIASFLRMGGKEMRTFEHDGPTLPFSFSCLFGHRKAFETLSVGSSIRKGLQLFSTNLRSNFRYFTAKP
jgi:hypothetical protein